MIDFKTKKLSTSFLYPIFLTIFVILMIITIYDAFQNRKRLINELNENADQLLNISAAAAVDAFWNYNDVSLIKIGDALAEYQEVAVINILDEKNYTVYGVNKSSKEYQSKYLYPTYNREVYRDDIKMGEIHLGFTTYYLNKEIKEAVLLGFTRSIIISFIISLLILFISRNITESIDNIGEGVKAFSKGNRVSRINVKNSHEIGQLAERINHMFDIILESDLRLQRLAYNDVLTGMPNRAMLFDHLNKLLVNNNQPLMSGALIYLDLDDFKTINDTKGHTVGDQVLVQIAKELETSIKYDEIARLGGDEFVVIQKNCDANQAGNVANDIINLIRKPRTINGYEFNLSCSIGIAIFPKDGTAVDTLLMRADYAMYQAKALGKDQYKFYEQCMNNQMVKKIELQNEMRQGILNKEFVLYYQPQVEIETGKVIGVEALVRWQHPVQGLLQPISFISLAEETGLIIPLGEYILRTACQQSVEWENAGYKNIFMSVNISAKQLNKKSIVQDFLLIINEIKMNPELLILEITESIAMENIEHTLEVINCLKEKGITFSLDDFGTGYSSLNYLKNLPINHLKIDKQFVQSLQKQNFEEVVVKAIIEIAHTMELTIVAEGIETIEQREIMTKYNCDLAQGYYFSKPIPKQEVEGLLMKCLPI